MKRACLSRKIIALALSLALLIPVFAVEIYADYEDIRVGSTVTFGSYEQDDITLNGSEPIDWYVLYIDDDDTALLVSKYVLFSGTYNDTWASTTWDRCTLRDWMNDVFYKSAFSSSERDAIEYTIISEEKNPTYKTSGGDETEDKVFVLSIGEVNKYMKEKRLMKGIPTEYAIACGVRESKDGTCWYWLRNPGKDRTQAAYITTKGTVSDAGVPLNYSDGGVRPAIRVNIRNLD